MMRGQEKTSTSQVGRRKGSSWESPIASSLVASMSMEELRSFRRVPDGNNLEFSNGHARPTVRQADNAIYFTREQFAAGFRFPISLLVKQFLHVTRALPVLIHPNVFRILMGCSVLNFLYRLDIFLVEICFIYTLKLGTGGRLFMSTHSPQLQLITGLPNSPKIEAKEVVLVKGLWYEMLGSPGLPFDVNHLSSSQVGLSSIAYQVLLDDSCFDTHWFS